MTPLVSIIIPAYNVSNYIGKTIDSCINQTLKTIEIIIINDGSVDNTQDIIDRYKKKDDRIVSFTQKNKGVTKARNFGLEQSKGEYIFFLDGDDYIAIDALKIMYNSAKKHAADFVVGDFTVIYENGEKKERRFFDFGCVNNLKFLQYCFFNNDFYFTGRLIRSSFLKSIKLSIPTNITYGEDNVAIVQIGYQLNKAVKTNNNVLFYVQRPNSVTNRLSLTDLRERGKAYIFLLKYAKENMFYSELESEINLYFLRQIYYGIATGYVEKEIAIYCLKKLDIRNKYFVQNLGFKQMSVLLIASLNLKLTLNIIAWLKKLI